MLELVGGASLIFNFFIPNSKAFYKELGNTYNEIRKNMPIDSYALIRFPIVFTDKEYMVPQAPKHPARIGYWTIATGNVIVKEIGSKYYLESKLREIGTVNM